jgi:hypothetical protein
VMVFDQTGSMDVEPVRRSPSSSGLGYRVFIPAAGVQIPLGTPEQVACGLQGDRYNGRVAQLGEHPAYIRKVTGSSPVSPTELVDTTGAWSSQV